MIARKVTLQELQAALVKVNQKYDDNIRWNRLDCNGSALRFTLRVKDSKLSGARRGFTGRRLVSACWHVHGDFFDALFQIQPAARIRSQGKLITAQGGNWVDGNIGSIMSPLAFSEACDC